MVYVHIPFCRSFCTYCGFYSEVAPKCRETQFEEFAEALVKEIETRRQDIHGVFASGDVNTLYIGGGTPSVLPPAVFEKLLTALGRSGFDEFTVEVNPEDIVEKGPEYVEGLLAAGVNRISMGVQSFDDRLLKWMNRRHSSSQAVQAYHILESAGVDNISIDLIFGLPQLTDELWDETLEKALAISSNGNLPKHISAYQLSVEEGSMLEKMISKGMCAEAPEEDCHRQYEMLCSVLRQAGYEHYEISNFAMPGYQAKHNSSYWKHVPYVGLGPGAHSFLDGKRMWNADDLSAYLKAGSNGDFSEIRGCETLDLEQKKIEKIMLGLRTAAGVEEEFLRDSCAGTVLAEALANGNLEVVGNGMVRIPEDRFFISDNIISSII